MSKNNLVYSGHPALKTVCTEVEHGTDMKELASIMFTIIARNGGIGLAANQLGVTARMIVIHVGGFKRVLINPVIVKKYPSRGTSKEGCLSYPGARVNMKRYKRIIVEGFTEDWEPVRFKMRNGLAYCMQHELDHLNGISIVD